MHFPSNLDFGDMVTTNCLPDNMTVSRVSLAIQVAQKLTELIQDGTLPPGAHLLENDLAYKLGVSRVPIREALRILKADSLVENIPGKGSYVAMVSREDACELYSLRTYLEEEAVRLACREASSDQFDCLNQILQDLLKVADSDNYLLVAEKDAGFHQYIWQIAGHKRLQQTLLSMLPHIRRYHSLQTHLFESLLIGINDHQEIYQSICERDDEAGVLAMRRHLTNAMEAAMENLPTIALFN
jgi:DNA-binding GntR family transcriptional regulator